MFFEDDQGSIIFGFHSKGDKLPACDHYDLVLLLNIIRVFTGPNWRPKNATIQTESTEAFRTIDAFADCEIEFNATLVSVKIPAHFLVLKNTQLHSTSDCPLNDSDSKQIFTEEKSLGQVIQKLLYQQMNNSKPFTINEIVEITGLNRIMIYRYLKKEGLTYSEIIERVRFEKARTLLQSIDYSVKEISFELGYSSPAAFSRAFKRLAAITPSAYQKLSLKN